MDKEMQSKHLYDLKEGTILNKLCPHIFFEGEIPFITNEGLGIAFLDYEKKGKYVEVLHGFSNHLNKKILQGMLKEVLTGPSGGEGFPCKIIPVLCVAFVRLSYERLADFNNIIRIPIFNKVLKLDFCDPRGVESMRIPFPSIQTSLNELTKNAETLLLELSLVGSTFLGIKQETLKETMKKNYLKMITENELSFIPPDGLRRLLNVMAGTFDLYEQKSRSAKRGDEAKCISSIFRNYEEFQDKLRETIKEGKGRNEK